ILAMAVPTTLMGATLPVLGRVVADRAGPLGAGLGLLYGVNTLGAVAGALATGILLPPATSASATLAIAITTNAAIGIAALLADRFARSETIAAVNAHERSRLA